jgi:hypothetical protein
LKIVSEFKIVGKLRPVKPGCLPAEVERRQALHPELIKNEVQY